MSEEQKRGRAVVVCGALLFAVAATAAAARPPSVPATWRSHHVVLRYYGTGALYTCDGIESKVRDILSYLGAGQNMRLAVSNCVGIGRPSRTATVTVDFHSLEVTARTASHRPAGRWVRFTIAPGRPFFMGQGECELVRQMEPLIRARFDLRDLRYETHCAPRGIALGSYEVSGEVLRPANRAADEVGASPAIEPVADTSTTRCRGKWVGAWGFPATPPLLMTLPGKPPRLKPLFGPVPDFDGTTVRQIVRVSAAATCLRIRISNEFGSGLMRLGAVHVALASAHGGIVPGSDHVLTFSGETAIVVPPGAPMLSDPIAWKVPALARLAVSVYLPEKTTPPGHRLFEYVSAPGNFSDSAHMPGAERKLTGALVSQVDVVSPTARRTVVTLGDSITEGFGSTPNAFRGWADRLADRLQRHFATDGWAVVDAGIDSNRLLHNGPGIGALARFDRDVLSVPGVSMIILLEGINDIGYSHEHPAQAVTARDIIAAYRQLIARAHAHGIRIVAGTLSPFEGAHYYTLHGEQMREAVNHWLRTTGAFDGVIDFDAALRDPSHPREVIPTLQRGDHLHPNDAGYERMALAIPLGLFERARGSSPGRRH